MKQSQYVAAQVVLALLNIISLFILQNSTDHAVFMWTFAVESQNKEDNQEATNQTTHICDERVNFVETSDIPNFLGRFYQKDFSKIVNVSSMEIMVLEYAFNTCNILGPLTFPKK